MANQDTRAVMNFKFMEMMKLLNIYLNHFPRHEKFALALQIRQTAYRVFDLMVECQKRYFKKLLIEHEILNQIPQRSQICLNM